MKESAIFGWVCQALSNCTALSENEARGTVRLVLKDAGLDPKLVNRKQMSVVLTRLLPGALGRLKVQEPKELCVNLEIELQAAELDSPMLTVPEDVFGRLAR